MPRELSPFSADDSACSPAEGDTSEGASLTERPTGVFIAADSVYKEYPGAVEIEYEKALALFALARRAGFVMPEPLALDLERCAITYAREESDGLVRDHYLVALRGGSASALEVIERVGRDLAIIHRDLRLESSTTWVPTVPFVDALHRLGWRTATRDIPRLPTAFLHCDYGWSNIHYRREGGGTTLIVYDASPDGMSTFAADQVGPVYVDLGSFMSCLEGRIPGQEYLRLSWKKLPVVKEAFVRGYEDVSGTEVDRRVLARFSYGIAACYFHWHHGAGRMRRIHEAILFNRLKGNWPIA
jgi:hypothetical protein